MNTFFNATVQIQDPAGIFESDKELTVQMTFDSREKSFLVRVPEPKATKPKTPKPKPVEVFNGMLTGVLVTKRVDGTMQMYWKAKNPEKLVHIGRQACGQEIEKAQDAMWKNMC